MASEIIVVPEQYLREVIAVIRTGLHYSGTSARPDVSEPVLTLLEDWCAAEEAYLQRLEETNAKA